MTDWSLDSASVSLSPPVTLVVGRRSGKKLRGNKVEFHDEVRDALVDVCGLTLERIAARAARQFEPDLRIDPEHEYLAVPDAAVDTDAAMRALLDHGPALDPLSARELPRQGFLFYAAIFGRTATNRHAFVRKWNPRKTVTPGRLVTFFEDRLRRVDDPVLVFDDHFDLVVSPGGIAVLNQDVFEALFRDIAAVEERIPDYVKTIAEALPLGADGADILADRCRANSRLAKKVRSIHERGHLKKVTAAQLRREMQSQGLDPSEFIKKGKLDLEDTDTPTLLKFLNEDLFVGGLSGERFEAGSKAVRN